MTPEEFKRYQEGAQSGKAEPKADAGKKDKKGNEKGDKK